MRRLKRTEDDELLRRLYARRFRALGRMTMYDQKLREGRGTSIDADKWRMHKRWARRWELALAAVVYGRPAAKKLQQRFSQELG